MAAGPFMQVPGGLLVGAVAQGPPGPETSTGQRSSHDTRASEATYDPCRSHTSSFQVQAFQAHRVTATAPTPHGSYPTWICHRMCQTQKRRARGTQCP